MARREINKREYIAYRGDSFEIEWYYDEYGESQAFDYFASLEEKRQDKVFYLFKRMGDSGKIQDITKFRNEGDEIFAFKPKPDRFLCFFRKGKKIVVVSAFEKRQDKLPKQEKVKALKCKADYEKRVEKGAYYG